MLDLLARYYPRYHSNEILLLADDIIKWINNELPQDSSTLIYLQSMYDSPAAALKAIWKEIQLLAGPFISIN
jgi:rhodanese-related sulfurtransferase